MQDQGRASLPQNSLNLPERIAAVSFDVFDTVLVRKVHRPADIHGRVGRRLSGVLSSSGRNYAQSRRSSEGAARQTFNDAEEITHDQIMSMLQRDLGIDAAGVSKLADAEVEEELRSVVPIQCVKDLIREVRRSGRRVLFISDMYLPEPVIRQMLERIGILELDDRVYVSGARGVRKASGALFRYVLDDLGLQPGQLMHIGDYLWSDYLVPRWKLGISAGLVREASSNIYEQLWGERCGCPYCSSVAGSSRAARVLRGPARNATSVDEALYNLGCDVLGPILLGFILWTLRCAEKEGVRRLYFLSRDGEIMLDVAKVLVRELGIDIELRYLHVSRTAVFPALLGTSVNASTLEWLREKTITLTPRILAERLKVDSINFSARLQELGIDMGGPDAPLSRKRLDMISRLLTTDPELMAMLNSSGITALRNLTAYLEQEGLFDKTPFALVDLGWHGGIQDVFFACFKERFEGNAIRGYYFGVDLEGVPSNRKYGYVFSHSDRRDIDRYRHLFRIIIELLCSGSHGMVRGYRRDPEGRSVPMLVAVEHPGNWKRIATVREGVQDFLLQVDWDDIACADHGHGKLRTLDVLKKLFLEPSVAEAVALGDLHFSADQAGHGIHRVASPFNLLSAARYLFKRSYAGRSTISSWFFASWRRSNRRMRAMLYPVVLMVRVYYLRADLLSFSRLHLLDVLNRWIDVSVDRHGGIHD